MTIEQKIKSYARADIKSIAQECLKRFDLVLVPKDMSVSRFEDSETQVRFELSLRSNDSKHVIDSLILYLTYSVENDNIYLLSDISTVADKIKHSFDESFANINASTKSNKQRITAADEDILEEDDGFVDTLDDLADSVEDVQDQVDDIVEDDVTIDINNNIDGHYIAECDTCHGVFISAVLESDQEIEHLTGLCPLCEKGTNQYLKWVIKSVDD